MKQRSLRNWFVNFIAVKVADGKYRLRGILMTTKFSFYCYRKGRDCFIVVDMVCIASLVYFDYQCDRNSFSFTDGHEEHYH